MEYFPELASVFMVNTTSGVPLISTIIEPGRMDKVKISLPSTPLDESDDFTASVNSEIVVWLIDGPNTKLNTASNSRRIESMLAGDE